MRLCALFSHLRHFRRFASALLVHGPHASTFLPPLPRHGFAFRASHTSSVHRYYEGSDSCPRSLRRQVSPLTSPNLPIVPPPTTPCAPLSLVPPSQRIGLFPGFAMESQARRYTMPNQVRHPTDRQFASSCSPLRLAATQLPSATESWHTPTRTSTALIWRHHGRTIPAFAGMKVLGLRRRDAARDGAARYSCG